MRLYFMSICGTGMGNAALLLREAGHTILGADHNTYPPMSDWLASAGIDVLPGFDAARLAALAPDCVIVGNVNTRGNPEVEWLLDSRAIPCLSLPEALARWVLGARHNIVVAGTHGKTTTTCLTACLLRANGVDPGYLIGGVPRDLPGGACLGAADAPFVIEGDEYDSAFFDKRSKFIHYQPRWLVLNNLEFDHADIFRDLEDVLRTFRHLVKLVPRSGAILINGDDPNLASLLPIPWAPVFRVGADPAADLHIAQFAEDAAGASFSLYWRGKHWADVRWQVWGLYNARNAAMAALAAGLSLNPADPTALDLSALASFRGVQRRQQTLGATAAGTTILTDFAHHPTAIRQTIESLRYRFPGRTITACFEARSNTACRKVLEVEFEAALAAADRIHLGAVYRADRYTDDDRMDLPAVARRIGPRAVAYADNQALATGLAADLAREPRQTVCFFSNGSFDGVPATLCASLGIQPPPADS
jgi:UDP-N-acetylmuramate: L-alanyl-gamma-D-glutamyl-meso-diaminopimelate ligase